MGLGVLRKRLGDYFEVPGVGEGGGLVDGSGDKMAEGVDTGPVLLLRGGSRVATVQTMRI